ncbi:NADH:flavorubredoxin reductase NorW [Vibrio parahaemolyticus]|uniref:NADH:flavorubredoxin reductase NorW n=1 Tax=Vibrio parahaemolyticus TaxID=670 RepID=UPI001B82F07F|nr:NADH:flavorubredoxin reductase NorW [Vibrio parahaemolyticus]ELC3206121.1 NADH:flavorubredoxin reductase NorW [Vibrio parahaemolyticus]MCI9688718.1 NADH:flavorubredoxin reductase NorW [Vibrio parahaemolyticus]MCR9694123.1 NADH:flavorubredoxin reductase NorW [Vibrio parahaemolyticus]MCR9760921.1 NADH:flavorubredoxin reductase NorW [Vibrio parahaemolyticus]MCR9815071.1 NADH:flavorubredoxin reductase NorW [Vibrio parahaemolyticus]
MQKPIVIIGSGFAAYQLIKTVRRMDAHIPIQVFTAEDGAEYNKPDLSHVFSRKQTASDLVVKSGDVFAKEHNIELFANTKVEKVDVHTQRVTANGQVYPYGKLVFATGAKAFVPPMNGDGVRDVLTLNSLQEYQAGETHISRAKRVLIIGGGLIGVEIAMDLATSGKNVTVIEPNTRLLANLIPEFIALPIERQLKQQGVQLVLETSVVAVDRSESGSTATLSSGRTVETDIVISAAGLCANTQLAKEAAIRVNKGIVVDSRLQTSTHNVFALGDCVEIQERMMPYLQPIVLSANVLGKQLLGQDAELVLPPMMVKVKTPSYPIQLAGTVNGVENWEVSISAPGIVAKATDDNGHLVGFVVTREQVTQAFPLLRELSKLSGQ